jgi:transcriptional regulator with XRE-family HTH domain
MNQVGHEVRRLREAWGWNQAKLAVEANMAPSAVNQIENGKRNPGATSLEKLAKALGVEVADLFPKDQASLPFDDASEQRRPSVLADALTAAADLWARAASDRELDARVAFGIATAGQFLDDLLCAQLGEEEVSVGLTAREISDVGRVQAKLEAVEARRTWRMNAEMQLEALDTDLKERAAAWKVPIDA